MDIKPPQKLWIPYLVAIVGTILSTITWYLFWRDEVSHYDLINVIEAHLAWAVLILGTTISILVAVIIRITQLANERLHTVDKINRHLKNEIAERANAEETKQKLEVALLQGQKLQAIGTLAGGIAHDFNNLLYAIIGYVEMAREDVEKESLLFKNFGKVLEATHRGQELIARILSFSRRQHRQFDPINLKTTIEAALGLLGRTIPTSVIIQFESQIENAPILGNQTQIHQVLVNIINNAVDAMDGEGSIHITLSHMAKDDMSLKQFHDVIIQNYYKIEIKDTGHGMDQSTIDRIFEPFFTTKEVGKGTGLGLSIVHSIIKEHLGNISVKSRLGHGTIFTILLPEHERK